MQRTLGFTAIYVTHDQAEAMELADRVAVMDHGRVAQLGEPREMYREPRDIHVARFLGQSNEIPFVVERSDEGSQLVVGSGPIGPVRASWLNDTWTGNPPTAGEELIAFGRLGDLVVRSADRDGGPGANAAAGEMNRWGGTIEAVRFMGTHTQYQVKIGKVRLRAWATAETGAELEEGRSVVVLANPRDLRVMREPQG
jgi:iron(III) transport system ATP-binding protein